jgi:filamentous hemagglutinin
MADIWWGRWVDYPKVQIGDKVYAKVGDRLYTKHAVDYFLPSGSWVSIRNVPTSREQGGRLSGGRSIPPLFVEDAILSGKSKTQTVSGVERTVYLCGDLEVVTEDHGRIVVTISYRHS